MKGFSTLKSPYYFRFPKNVYPFYLFLYYLSSYLYLFLSLPSSLAIFPPLIFVPTGFFSLLKCPVLSIMLKLVILLLRLTTLVHLPYFVHLCLHHLPFNLEPSWTFFPLHLLLLYSILPILSLLLYPLLYSLFLFIFHLSFSIQSPPPPII